MRGLLVRVGIDSTSGGWNAPFSCKTNRFVFVPIPDCPYNPSGEYVDGGKRTYGEVLPELDQFAKECGIEKSCSGFSSFELPSKLTKAAMHLDPDFENLTYGDDARRGKKLRPQGKNSLRRDDFVVFYAGLRSIEDKTIKCALIGVLEIDHVSGPAELQGPERLCNAHSRWVTCDGSDVVVFGKRDGMSGLFDHCIPIGGYRDNAHRVDRAFLDEWGDLSVKDGYIQRSGVLPEFKVAHKFMEWLQKKIKKEGITMAPTRYRAAN